ncbi:MAG TPA: YSC84-related protein [Paraburkholderia sp.]|uniref:BPSL1445 family SYLF domain-containing lipoprotein n=1 Tax=Paraburkholderia sp. TaxID=1926495 RepID=UPI002B6272B7|nr:YSC84-related protein [Paraburkholderia sp.]HTR09697.1 YSC84-related protein [Paraburkholderia sp.]
MKKRDFLAGGSLAVAGWLAATAGCTTTGSATADPAIEHAAARREIEAGVDEVLARLYRTIPGSRELVAKARGVLVFPDVTGVGFVVGAEYGRGALRVEGNTLGYFTTMGGSFGAQFGAQSRAVVYAFMTRTSLDRFKRSSGWNVGADATVALVKMGANGKIDTTTAINPIEAFVLTNAGLMAGVSLEGSKVSRLDI